MVASQQIEMRSAIFKTRKQSKSLRTTIPEAVVQALKLTDNDFLDWNIEAVGGDLVVRIRKASRK
jgi:antitoxin component of MazEF toxin-antitoxin module